MQFGVSPFVQARLAKIKDLKCGYSAIYIQTRNASNTSNFRQQPVSESIDCYECEYDFVLIHKNASMSEERLVRSKSIHTVLIVLQQSTV